MAWETSGLMALVRVWGSLDLEKRRGLPRHPAVLPNDWEDSSNGRGTLPGRQGGKPCCGGGCWPSCHAAGEGQGQSRSGRVRGALSSPRPALVGESVGWALPLALVLLPLGDEGLPLPRLGVGAWVTKAALYPLGTGAVTWPRSEDIVSAWG